MFSMAVWRGTVAGPLHWRAGWQTGSLPRPIALNAYFCQELECVLLPRNCPLVNYSNETMSEKRIQESSQVPSRKRVASPISGFVSRANFSPGGVYDIERRIVPKSIPLSSCTKNNSFLWCAAGRSERRRKNVNLLSLFFQPG